MNYLIREAGIEDAPAVARLFSAGGNPHRWSSEKYLHYYRDYPEGPPFAQMAENAEGRCVGFYGLLPLTVSGHLAFMQLHVMVEENYRRFPITQEFLYAGLGYARSAGADMLVAFSNYKFSQILRRLFQWKLLGYLRFVDIDVIEPVRYRDRLRFEYSDAWYNWKFGQQRDIYFQEYMKDDQQISQLLKIRGCDTVKASKAGRASFNYWMPEAYCTVDPGGWRQSVTVKPLNHSCIDRVSNIENWYIEMGDSDTFEYNLPERLEGIPGSLNAAGPQKFGSL
jgi:hypothetical protein